MSAGFVDNRTLFIDAIHIKAAANNKKYINREAKRAAKFYEKALREEIEKDRKEHGKKPLTEDPPHDMLMVLANDIFLKGPFNAER